jgi:CelD/BcsL family acetyltransferase involved in cellulose biosynthesis
MASVFHSPAWVEALHRTYAYEPVIYTTAPPGAKLTNGILLCRVRSWLTGRRMVSVPFADHCEPLVESPHQRNELLAALEAAAETQRLNYVELRLRTPDFWHERLHSAASFLLHVLDLRPAVEELFGRTHKGSIQRKIRRASREALVYEEGRSERLLKTFYDLLLPTRRRHGLAPQPIQWFRNLMACFGDRLTIRVASKDGRPTASFLTLRHGDTLVYKYGCSDARYHPHGSVPFLLWRTIQEAKAAGLRHLDLGRSDSDQAGLITFKERWGAGSSTLSYVRCSPQRRWTAAEGHRARVARNVFARMPDRFLVAAGTILYRHMG